MADASTAGSAVSSVPFFTQALVFLGGAVIAAPIFKRIGLGTVLGYLAAGIVIGPVLEYVTEGEAVLHFAELGIVFLLFLIGLELQPSRLWKMRGEIFGLGAAQVLGCGLVIGLVAWAFGDALEIGAEAAIIVGLGLALSSTAFAMQLLEERRETGAPHGRRAFSILLFQDLAIVPLLVLVPLLAAGGDMGIDWGAIAIAVLCVAALVLAGLYLLNPLFAIIARTGAREVMIAAALAVVLGAAALMQYAGLSMAMGAFIAGVLLSESSYRHELEADIEPFRGLLLGLFFMAVGLSLSLDTLAEHWPLILAGVPVLLAVKAAIIYGLARLFGSSHPDALRIGALLPQGGEFGFVLFSAAATEGLLTPEATSCLVAMVTLSMALTPLTVALGARLAERHPREDGPEAPEEDFEDAGSEVLMVGFSRLGQIAYQTLLSGGQDVTIIDNDPEMIEAAARFGSRIYYGDGTRKEVLEAAGIRGARLVAVTTRDPDTTTRNPEATRDIVDLLRSDYPDKAVYVRSYDRNTSLEHLGKGVEYEVCETLHSALRFGRDVLIGLGMGERQAEAIRQEVEDRDAERLQRQRSEGIYGGSDLMHTTPQTPTPLDEPEHEGRILNEDEIPDGANDNQGRDDAHVGDARGTHDGDARDGDGSDGLYRQPAE